MVTSTAGGYRLFDSIVTPGALGTVATREGLAHRVITALSFDSGQVHYMSYAWQHDTTTAYETQVAPATFATVDSAAEGLAASGYMLTAFGGDSADGFIFVGTRAKGATAPRALQIDPAHGADLTGYAPVAYLFQITSAGLTTKLIFER
ncbi:MAG TPA: hypothetical protein VEV39_07360, partial [Gemmatimonadales bacterium]|nr:hypothetical protein [Gemmatimonadales bacterium]